MALIPPFFLDCIVAIGLVADDGSHQWKALVFCMGVSSKTDHKPKSPIMSSWSPTVTWSNVLK